MVALNSVVQESEGAAPPLLVAHGLFGSARNWGVIARRLSDRGRVVAVDMRNHGDSPWTERHAYADLAGDLAETIDGCWDVLGHSMGGKAAMALALLHPGKVRRLIVADIAPLAYGHSQQVYIDAMRSLDLDAFESRRGADTAMTAHVPDDGIRAFLLQSLDVRARKWRLNLDLLEAEMPRIVGWPGIEGRFDGPVLFLSGGDSDYVTDAARGPIRDLFPRARFASLPGAGHWLHAERPREVEASVRAFLDA